MNRNSIQRKPPSRLLLATLAVTITLGLSAAWTAVAVITGSLAAWMALVAAVDAAVLLRIAGHRPGMARAATGLSITLATIACSAVLVAAARIGQELGMRPVAALDRISAEMVPMWLAAQLGPTDLAWLAAGAVLAFLGSR